MMPRAGYAPARHSYLESLGLRPRSRSAVVIGEQW